MRHNIVLKTPENKNCFILSIETDNSNINPVTALKVAVKDFSETEEFNKYMTARHNKEYNWLDVLNSIPDEITEKHGVIITHAHNCRYNCENNCTHNDSYTVNCDENLLD